MERKLLPDGWLRSVYLNNGQHHALTSPCACFAVLVLPWLDHYYIRGGLGIVTNVLTSAHAYIWPTPYGHTNGFRMRSTHQ
eukprot:scaffold631929_cov22-Prasinocladus_malaysianus.AAC.1